MPERTPRRPAGSTIAQVIRRRIGRRGVLKGAAAATALVLVGAEVRREQPARAQVDYELASHGASIVELERQGPRMVVRHDSPYNRRITATTPMTISGPAAGHPWLRTSADPTGRTVLGTLNNRAGGYTPWGTILTAEENFHQYFANAARMPENEPRAIVHARYGLPAGRSERGWEDHYARFDVWREPNEPFRFGWVVEVDPYDPTSQPVKRTALGRFRHEGCTFAISPSGRVAFYSGDDERFDCAYKFVTATPWNPNDPAANRDLLDDGTLYVARASTTASSSCRPKAPSAATRSCS
jgi:secreted PhoX family phosphatase